jgi:hypothetical protein
VKIFEHVLLIGELLMELKMVETVFEYLVVDAALILVVFVGLLPFEVQK